MFMKVLSKSVTDGFMKLRRLNFMEANTVATELFVRILDKFFDLIKATPNTFSVSRPPPASGYCQL